MKKRWLAVGMIVVMLCMQMNVGFAKTAEERLAAVTQKVKETLSLDTGAYTQFYGDMKESVLAPTWRLEWTAEDGRSLSVSATEEGKILSYNQYTGDTYRAPEGFAPSFPKGNQDEAKAAAEAFLNRVLEANETVTVESGQPYLGATQYRFYGEILLHGHPADMTYSISVQGEDAKILSFYRDDFNGMVTGEIPPPEPELTENEARETLKETVKLRLEYVTAEENQAVLRYLPDPVDDYYVDAITGELVNLTELSRDLEQGYAGGGSNNLTMGYKEEAMADSSLSRVEQEGIDKLQGVLSKETLEQKAKEISLLGLDRYSLSAVQYSVSREENEDGSYPVMAILRFGKQVEGSAWRRTITMDAKTGQLVSVYSSASLPKDGKRTVNIKKAEAVAQAFAKQIAPGQFAKTRLYQSNDAMEQEYQVSHSFTYAQQENGHFFPENQILLGIDATDGTISRYEKRFHDKVIFDSPDGILTVGQAIDAWMETYLVSPRYVKVPYALDYSRPETKPLLDNGISYLYTLALGYMPVHEVYISGIDAKTGEPVKPIQKEENLSYTDIDGHWAESMIRELACYGVGFGGQEYLPEKSLSQRDLLMLLLSCDGYRPDETQKDAEELYRRAYQRGLLSKEERDDEKVLARWETVRLILNGTGYRKVANLEGIFKTGFTDDGVIPREGYGYVALAQGLGIVNGDEGRYFYPLSPTTRAEAAVMVYNLMK
ncbi:MAG: S-layer homology domain-containing protein [Clostridia bacterium]|nr:S-layer homology domain-containing protein [Clostridia bacterium]